MKMFSPVHSAMYPFELSMTASDAPCESASFLARHDVMYAPLTLAPAGEQRLSGLCHEDVTILAPLSAPFPRYSPMWTAVTDMDTGTFVGLIPTSSPERKMHGFT